MSSIEQDMVLNAQYYKIIQSDGEIADDMFARDSYLTNKMRKQYSLIETVMKRSQKKINLNISWT